MVVKPKHYVSSKIEGYMLNVLSFYESLFIDKKDYNCS